jgi:hypothetical protein
MFLLGSYLLFHHQLYIEHLQYCMPSSLFFGFESIMFLGSSIDNVFILISSQCLQVVLFVYCPCGDDSEFITDTTNMIFYWVGFITCI